MDLSEASAQALSIRQRFAAFERRTYGVEWSLSDLVAGLATDVGDLSRLIAEKQGLRPAREDLDAALGHELADVLWCVFVLADKVGVDVEAAFATTMAELHTWLDGHEPALPR